MRFNYLYLLAVFLLTHVTVTSQISQGGKPIQPLNLKSNVIPVVRMPYVDNESLLKSSVENYNNAEVLKPFTFAYTFDVNLNPQNSGRWIKAENGYNIWQIEINSEGAFSINLILEPFRLPPNARLFVFNKTRTHTIGAFTNYNNKSFNSLALSPVRGDDIILQYEEPVNPDFNGELAITKVNHDFAGILTDENGRRPLGKSGDCNIDINCNLAKNWSEIKNSVCRLIIDGDDICTGTLVNNTKEDKTPYILTAHHCFLKHLNGEQNTVFLFNYESPYCGSIDGDITNSISGSLKIADSDSLDFRLLKLTLMPPPEYRPYYAGWDNSGEIPDSVVSIHHPQGDIKKIAIDKDKPVKSSFGTEPNYISNGFWKTLNWEYGTTEFGSSGGPYFNQNHQLIGTLTGGAALCSNPVNDYFARFDFAWNHYSDTLKQIKYWLDPINSGAKKLGGLKGYTGEDYCDAFTNLVDGDNPDLIKMIGSDGTIYGFWAGTNTNGINEYVEKFSIPGNEVLEGISIGVNRIVKYTGGATSFITVNVYNGSQLPGSLIYSKDVLVYDLAKSAMNFINFDEVVQPADTFFVGFNISNVHNVDFAVYQANRKNTNNSLFYKKNNLWHDYQQEMDTVSAALAFELIACNVENIVNDTPYISSLSEIQIFPNPVNSVLNLRTSMEISGNDIFVYDLMGRQVNLKIQNTGIFQYQIDMSGNRHGIYFIRVKNNEISASEKFYYNPYYK